MTTPATPAGGQLGILFLVVFINLVGFGVILPVFPFFGSMVGASPTATTIAMAAYSLGQLIGAPLWGKVSDRIGRRPVLIWSLIGSLLSYFVMAVSHDIWTLGLARLFGGLMAGNIAAAFAYVGDMTDETSRPKAMGMIGAAFGLGFIFGPAIGGLIAGDTPNLEDFAQVCLVAAAITALAAAAVWWKLPESLTADRRAAVAALASPPRTADVLKAKPVIWALMALSLLVIGSAAMMETTFAFFARDRFDWGPRDVGLAFGLVGIIAATLQGGFAAPLNRKFGGGTVMVAGVIVYAIGLWAMGMATESGMLLITLAMTAAAVGLFNPAYQTLVAAESDDSDRGLVNGLTQAASSLGRVIGPGVSGSVYQNYGQSAPFTAGAVIMVIALVLAIGVRRRNI